MDLIFNNLTLILSCLSCLRYYFMLTEKKINLIMIIHINYTNEIITARSIEGKYE